MEAFTTRWTQVGRVPDIGFPRDDNPITPTFAKQILVKDPIGFVVKDHSEACLCAGMPFFDHRQSAIPSISSNESNTRSK
tara:strand:+ start:384 stop:623 length:240 start_codon:yes stop_codon:yes gene_type:complete